MLNWIRKRTRKAMHKSARPVGRPLRYDALEPRVMLAGDVTVAVVGDELQITGDVAANELSIRGTGIAGQYVIAPADKTTTINGQATRFTANKVNQFAIDLGDGNDRLNIAHAVVRGNVAIDLGEDAGYDMLAVSYSRIDGALNVLTGDGIDHLAISAVTVSGATRINTGGGADNLALSASRFNNSLSVNTGDGDDKLAVSAVRVVGSCVLDTGTGKESGNDSVAISASRFQGPTTVNLGDGEDKLAVTFSQFDTRLLADGGADNDSLLNRFNRFVGFAPTWKGFERVTLS